MFDHLTNNKKYDIILKKGFFKAHLARFATIGKK
jgi:hypothetical protein